MTGMRCDADFDSMLLWLDSCDTDKTSNKHSCDLFKTSVHMYKCKFTIDANWQTIFCCDDAVTNTTDSFLPSISFQVTLASFNCDSKLNN